MVSVVPLACCLPLIFCVVESLYELPNATEVGQHISSNKVLPHRGESVEEGLLGILKRISEQTDHDDMWKLVANLRSDKGDASKRLKALLWCEELVSFLREVVRIPGLKWSPILNLSKFIRPMLQHVYGGVSICRCFHGNYC